MFNRELFRHNWWQKLLSLFFAILIWFTVRQGVERGGGPPIVPDSNTRTFEHLPIHWAWWPALGALVLGLVGWFDPRVLGIGYENITNIINGQIVGTALALFIAAKFVGWVVYLGSGTSGGTLAPL